MTCHDMPRHDMPRHATAFMHDMSPNYEGGNYAGFSAVFSHHFCEGVNYAGFQDFVQIASYPMCERESYAGLFANFNEVGRGELHVGV